MADPDGGQTSTTNAYLPGENFGNSGGDVDQMEMDDPPFSPSSSFSSSSSSSSDLIPKPIGEAGRRNSGGYNLEEVLRDHGWDRKRFLKLRKYTVRRIEKYLDTRVSFKFQDKDALKQVIDAARNKFPDLQDYAHAWPVKDICKAHLRYTASRARANAHRRAEEVPTPSQGNRRRNRTARSTRV